MLHIGLGRGSWGIFADHESNGAMGVDVIRTILSVVFEHKNGCVIPVWAVGDGVDDAAQGQIVVGDVGGRPGAVGTRAAGVIVGQIEQNEAWHLEIGAFVRLAGAHVGAELVEKFVGPKLIGVIGV